MDIGVARVGVDSRQLETQLAFHPLAQRNASRHRDVRQQ
jgi:hypothetical protein